MVVRNTNPSYIADTSARIKARNEAAAIHMEDQGPLRKGVAKASLGLANGVDWVGSKVADAMTAGVLGGVMGIVVGGIVGALMVAGASLFVGPAVVGVGLVKVMMGLFAVTGFATEYTRIKALNPEKRMAGKADWLAAKGGALENPGFGPVRSRGPNRGPGARSNPGNKEAVDAATTGARYDTDQAREYVDRVAPGTNKSYDGRNYPPTDVPRIYTNSVEMHAPNLPEANFVEKENLRRGRERDAEAAQAAERSQLERLRERDQANSAEITQSLW